MSFMFNPYPFEDPTPVNRPEIPEEIIKSIIPGTKETATHIAGVITKKLKKGTYPAILGLDGYISAGFDQLVNLVSQGLMSAGIKVHTLNFRQVIKSGDELDELFAENLPEDREKDPILLFGRLFKGGYENLFDNRKLGSIIDLLKDFKSSSSGEVYIVYGLGCTAQPLRSFYDLICYLDVTPKEVVFRAIKGLFSNLGDDIPKPIKALLRRCYYVDFEVAGHLRWDLLKNDKIDFYIAGNDPDQLKMLPKAALNSILSSLVKYPFRCKPVYLEGVWGGHYMKRVRRLPDSMRNCAWIFDLIPLEVSIVVQAGKELLEFPFFTFVQKEGSEMMGNDCIRQFGGYFPIRFNYDDSYHSSGNMSIQVHSGHDYNIENYGEHGGQDESYYIVATGHEAKTYIGFKDDISPDEFIRKAKLSEKEFTPIDYWKYVNHVKSTPGVQFLLPAGTIHSSGRNQVVLEIGSLTVGSYTYKLYDYMRADLDGKPRPIHTHHGENVLVKERTSSWVKENLVQEPRLVRSGNNAAEYIIGEHDLLYFSLRRLEFIDSIDDQTEGKFHVLTLIDGEKVEIRSVDHPERKYIQHYLDIVVVPANVGKYRLINLGDQPVCIHKTLLKDGFVNKSISGH